MSTSEDGAIPVIALALSMRRHKQRKRIWVRKHPILRPLKWEVVFAQEWKSASIRTELSSTIAKLRQKNCSHVERHFRFRTKSNCGNSSISFSFAVSHIQFYRILYNRFTWNVTGETCTIWPSLQWNLTVLNARHRPQDQGTTSDFSCLP